MRSHVLRIRMRAMARATISAKLRKRDYRKLWIQRIGAASRRYDVPYNRLIYGLASQQIELNRKILSELAITEPYSFRGLAYLAYDANRTAGGFRLMRAPGDEQVDNLAEGEQSDRHMD
mmetsp:Transcript_6126/g.14897  ORF Transcript_6126/g.14897 Transcript_6126/m.14897 type:complete len:119 (+) Transcript_6126:278-634(+)